MRQVEIKNGIIEYFGNKIGYVSDKQAVVDEMFRKKELEEYLRDNEDLDVTWSSGVYDRIIQGNDTHLEILKKCRIYQLKPEVDAKMKFIGYRDLLEGGFGRPDITNYVQVFDGAVDTNDLDQIYINFNSAQLPSEYEGHALSKSDIIELYDESGSEFFYVDKFGFVKLEIEIGDEITESEDVKEIQEPQQQEKQDAQESHMDEELQELQEQYAEEAQQESPEYEKEELPETEDHTAEEDNTAYDEFCGEDFSFTM